MSAAQPVWKFVANLGDVHPIDYGGYFVFEDSTGVYAPEAELLYSPEDERDTWEVYRFVLEPCTFTGGILSDNRFHPDHPAWFADSIGAIAAAHGADPQALIKMLCSGTIPERAEAWRMIGQYHGFENLDPYPISITGRSSVQARYFGLPIKGL